VKSVYNKDVFREQCSRCGCRIVNTLHAHHIEEQAEGGSNHVRNMAVLCEECHIAHHSGLITVEPLRATSEGLERVAIADKPVKAVKKGMSYSEEEMNVILASLRALKGRDSTRIKMDLKTKGINITPAAIKQLIHLHQV
jgi:hypothetical protein